MMGLTNLELHNFIFNTTEQNNKFELYTDTFDGFSSEGLKEELEEIIDISNITSEHLQDKVIAPPINQDYKKVRSETSSSDGYIILLMAYARSLFRDFESYLRIVIG